MITISSISLFIYFPTLLTIRLLPLAKLLTLGIVKVYFPSTLA